MKKIAKAPSHIAYDEGVSPQALTLRRSTVIKFKWREYALYKKHYIIWPDGDRVDEVKVRHNKNGELELHQIYPSRIVQVSLPKWHLIVCVA